MKEQNPAQSRKAVNMAAIRAVVAAYLVYLGVSLIWDLLQGRSSMAPALAWAAGLGFVVCGLGFGWYTWRRYRAETRAAQDGPAEDGDDGIG